MPNTFVEVTKSEAKKKYEKLVSQLEETYGVTKEKRGKVQKEEATSVTVKKVNKFHVALISYILSS